MKLTDDVVVSGPKVNIYSIQHCKQWQPPRNTINNDLFSAIKELVDDGAQHQKMNQ